jgi:hypothetical protein
LQFSRLFVIEDFWEIFNEKADFLRFIAEAAIGFAVLKAFCHSLYIILTSAAFKKNPRRRPLPPPAPAQKYDLNYFQGEFQGKWPTACC